MVAVEESRNRTENPFKILTFLGLLQKKIITPLIVHKSNNLSYVLISFALTISFHQHNVSIHRIKI